MKEDIECEVVIPGLNHKSLKGKEGSTGITVLSQHTRRRTKETQGDAILGS